MPGYARSESGVRKSDFYTKFEFWLGLLAVCMSSFALYYSCDANKQSREVFEWQKEQVKASEQIKLSVLGEWMCDILILGEFKHEPGAVTKAGDELQFGILSKMILKVSNLSQRTATIDRMSIGYVLPSSVLSEKWGKLFWNQGDTTMITYPVVLAPDEQARFTVLVPIPVTDSVASLLSHLPKRTAYSCDSLLDYVSSAIGNRLGGVTPPRYLPEILIAGENYKHIRGDRQLEIGIVLASGSIHRETLDYIDINRWVVDF